MMRRELAAFFAALGFFTRLPIPAWVPWSPQRLTDAGRYLPLVGWVVGAIAALSVLGFALILPPSLAVITNAAVRPRAGSGHSTISITSSARAACLATSRAGGVARS